MTRIVDGPEVVEWVARNTNDFGNFGCAVGLGLEKDGEFIAGVVFNEYNGVNICMHVASDGSRRWLNRKFLYVCFDYAFRTAGCRRVTGLVGEGNTAARIFNERIGLTEETRLEGAHPTGDLIVYVMWKDTCKWLGLKDRYEQNSIH